MGFGIRWRSSASGIERPLGSHSRNAPGQWRLSQPCSIDLRADDSSRGALNHGNLDFAANTAGLECKVDRPAELLRDEIANDPDAVSAVGRSCHGGAADFPPCDRQVRRILASTWVAATGSVTCGPAIVVFASVPLGAS